MVIVLNDEYKPENYRSSVKESIYVIDIETDHLSPEHGSIVEIGIVRYNYVSGKIYPVFNSVVREMKRINEKAWIFEKSNLDFYDVYKAKPLSECRGVLQKLFSQGLFTAFNQKFDFGWLESRDFDIPNKFDDPMLALTPIMKLKHKDYWRIGHKWPSVEEAYYFLFGSKLKESHRAFDDAKVEAKIVREMMEKGYFLTERVKY